MRKFDVVMAACGPLFVGDSAQWDALVLRVQDLSEKMEEEVWLLTRMTVAVGDEYKKYLQEALDDCRFEQHCIASGNAAVCASLGHNTIPYKGL